MKKDQELVNAFGNLYRAAMLLGRGDRELEIAHQLLRQSIEYFEKNNRRDASKRLKALLEKNYPPSCDKKRLFLAEKILDQYLFWR